MPASAPPAFQERTRRLQGPGIPLSAPRAVRGSTRQSWERPPSQTAARACRVRYLTSQGVWTAACVPPGPTPRYSPAPARFAWRARIPFFRPASAPHANQGLSRRSTRRYARAVLKERTPPGAGVATAVSARRGPTRCEPPQYALFAALVRSTRRGVAGTARTAWTAPLLERVRQRYENDDDDDLLLRV